jgi:predicted transcriptional regulator
LKDGLINMNPALWMQEQVKRLQKYQVESGLSRYRLAELIGVTFPSVYYWLDGSTTPEKESREKLRRFLEREGYSSKRGRPS